MHELQPKPLSRSAPQQATKALEPAALLLAHAAAARATDAALWELGAQPTAPPTACYTTRYTTHCAVAALPKPSVPAR